MTRLFLPCFLAVLLHFATGCQVNDIKEDLAGQWKVTEWICDTGDGPFNFEKNVGWKFNFSSDDLKVVQNDDSEIDFKIHFIPESDPIQICLVAETDFDEDGKIDFTLQRNCLVKIDAMDRDKLTIVYGGVLSKVVLDTGEGESIPQMPTEFVADGNGSLLTLERVK